VREQHDFEFPIETEQLVRCVQDAWDDLLKTQIAGRLCIGVDFELPAQAIGVILEKLITFRVAETGPWRGQSCKSEKDVVHTVDLQKSFEIKTSSSSRGIYGNKSTKSAAQHKSKDRDGFMLAVNYDIPSMNAPAGKLRLIRIGWITDDDWVGQKSNTGQQAYIPAPIAKSKLKEIFAACV
jgi:hypothetical protein